MPVRSLIRALTAIALVCGVTFAAAAPGSAQAPPRACSAADLAGTRTPAIVEEDAPDGVETATLRTGKAYRASVIPEYGIGDDVSVRDGSVVVTGPPGLALTPRLDEDSGRQVFAFTPAAVGPLRLQVSWVAELGPPGAPDDACAATAAIDLTVAAPQLISTRAIFTKRHGGYPTKWTLRLVPPPLGGLSPRDARDPSPIKVLVRLRTGTTRPPKPQGRARYRISYRYVSGRDSLSPRRRNGPGYLQRIYSNLDWDGRGVVLQSNANVPRKGVRFAFSIEVRQAGRRIGGLRSGASCRSFRYRRSDGAMRTTSSCKRPHYAARP